MYSDSDIINLIHKIKSDVKYAIIFTANIIKKVNITLILSKEYKVILKAF